MSKSSMPSRTDGFYVRLAFRPIARRIAVAVHPSITANQVTAICFVLGCAGAIAINRQAFYTATIAILSFCIGSCVDGEVARLRSETSRIGDYYDTMVDRAVEAAIIFALVTQPHGSGSPSPQMGLLLLSGTMLLCYSSEKFHSAFKVPYPKAVHERMFLWITSGSDARLSFLSAYSLAKAFTVLPYVLNNVMNVYCALIYLNLGYRMYVVFLQRRLNTVPS